MTLNTTNYDNHSSEQPINERTPLLRKDSIASSTVVASTDDEESIASSLPCKEPFIDIPRQDIASVISVLLLGVFIANADGSLVLATSGTIASEFDDLGSAGWLITSYTLAMCASQSLYGKLSDIYGRKSTILVSYAFFAIGCAICGLGQSLPQVVFGRLVAGVGGAGINCLVSIVIADMVPTRDIAWWRSYVNVAATTGRSLGGPLGGYLTDTVGWRWSFLGQVIPTVLTMVLVSWKLHVASHEDAAGASQLSKLRRIDFLGAILFPISIVCGLLVLEFTGQRMAWTDPTILFLLGASLVSGYAFLLVEAFWAKEPIIPLRLLRNRDVITSYINLGFQSGGQIAMMLLVPIYFQVSAHASVTNAGAHLMPSVMGNAVGGILSGIWIRRTGRYKMIAVIGGIASTSSYLLLLARWHGHTSFLESLYIIGGGFGNGISLSTSFIMLTTGVEQSQMAIASSGLYLSSNVGCVAGLSIAAAIFQSSLLKALRIALEGFDGREEILNKALTDIAYVQSLKGHLGQVVTKAYVESLHYTHGVSVIGGIVTLISALSVVEHPM